MKLFEAKNAFTKAESIVWMLKIGCAANESILNEKNNDEDMSLYKLIQSMADGNKDAKKILSEIAKTSSKNDRYLLDMHRLGIKGNDIVSAYDFCGFNLLKLFDVLDYDTPSLISYLAKFNMKGDSENG